MKFFDKLLHLRIDDEIGLLRSKRVLQKIHDDQLNKQEQHVILHEKPLAKLERNEHVVEDWDYR